MKYLFSTEYLEKLYEDLLELGSFASLGRVHKIKGETLKRHLKESGYLVEKVENFFEVIDEEIKAYYVGLLIGDGCVHNTTGNKSPVISIGLKEPDSYILRELCQKTYPYKKLGVYKNGGSFAKHQLGVWTFSSKKMAEDLSEYGVVPNKTNCFEARLPILKDSFMPALIRGLLDSDGSVANKTKTFQVTAQFLSTSKLLIEDLQSYLTNFDIRVKVRKSGGSSTSMGTRKVDLYCGVIEDINSLINLYNFLYSNATIFLIRKKYKFHIETLVSKSQPHKGEQCPSCFSYRTWKRNYYKSTIYYNCVDCNTRFNIKVSGNTVLTN